MCCVCVCGRGGGSAHRSPNRRLNCLVRTLDLWKVGFVKTVCTEHVGRKHIIQQEGIMLPSHLLGSKP